MSNNPRGPSMGMRLGGPSAYLAQVQCLAPRLKQKLDNQTIQRSTALLNLKFRRNKQKPQRKE